MARGKTGRFFIRLILLGGAASLVFLGLASFRVGPAPTIEVRPELPGIGRRTPVYVSASESKRGLSGLRIELVQGDRVQLVEARPHIPLPPWGFWGDRTTDDELTVEVGSETIQGLREGDAIVRVTANRAGSWLRRPQPVVSEVELPVMLRAPALQVMSSKTYVSQGGCEAVVYRVGKSALEDGVQAGDWWFPGFPLPGGDEQDRFALFGAPYDLSDPAEIRLVARDMVGNEARASFIDRFFAKPFRNDTIRLSESFMQRVVPAILSQTPELADQGDLLQNYLNINGELRRQNTKTLIDLADRSQQEFLWSREFLQMTNAQVMSAFADRRTYTYEGREVDQQDHLGFDLASTGQAAIESANDGTVLLARYFGIYGNAVVVDHGYGLMSLYGHLSSLAVEEGQSVGRGELLGRSGLTGLAGGDHLHFTTLLRGLAVNPTEWWDAHWIHDRLELKLGRALPFEE